MSHSRACAGISASPIKIYLISRTLFNHSTIHSPFQPLSYSFVPISLAVLQYPSLSRYGLSGSVNNAFYEARRCRHFQADSDYLIGPHLIAVDENGLETTVLSLEFRIANKHFRRGDMKLKCLATIATVYLQSNEESVEGDESVLKTPMMESRETRAQSHTREDLTNGKLL